MTDTTPSPTVTNINSQRTLSMSDGTDWQETARPAGYEVTHITPRNLGGSEHYSDTYHDHVDYRPLSDLPPEVAALLLGPIRLAGEVDGRG